MSYVTGDEVRELESRSATNISEDGLVKTDLLVDAALDPLPTCALERIDKAGDLALALWVEGVVRKGISQRTKTALVSRFLEN